MECELIEVQFGDRPAITRRVMLESAERNVLAAIQQPELRRPLLRMAMRRLEVAMEVQKRAEGGGA